VGGAVVLVYNLPHFSGELKLTPELIAGIFSGTLRKWNDRALSAANPSVSLPDALISTFHRSDGSGTTFVFTEYLSKVNSMWKSNSGTGATVRWGSGTAINGNDALAQSIASTPFSIGYVEFIYAFDHHLNIASVRNPSGRFIQPDLLSIMAAANAVGTKESGLSITASQETSAYPISTFSWLVVNAGRNRGREPRSPHFWNGC
jgi:phosphate transport system substrate-binding protein